MDHGLIASARRAAESGRGRRAERPGAIPRRGWRDILLRVKDQMGEDHVSLIAAGVTFYVLLALFPLLAALVSVYGLVADPAQIQSQMETLRGVIPAAGLQIIGDQLSKLADAPRQGLGFVFLGGLALSLWSANKGIKVLFEALNIAYEEREQRGFFKLNAVSLLFTALGVVGLIVALFALVALPPLLAALAPEGFIADLLLLGRWPILVLMVALGAAVLYRYGPSRRRARWRWIVWGALAAALLWVAASGLFSWYLANFGNYNETYGTLGAAVGFLMWVWLSAMIFVLGAELASEIEHQTAADTTVGPPRPLGERGARMADTIGPGR